MPIHEPKDTPAIQQDRAALEEAVAEIRARFGRDALAAASVLGSKGLVVPRQRAVPFGPVEDDQGEGESQAP